MDELELLKKDWKENKSDDFKNYTEQELFAMTKKRSVSIAKWVFIIALLELGFWFLIVYLMPSSSEDKYQDIPFVDVVFNVMDIISILLPFVFIGSLLYLNFKIRTEENPKKLMEKILLMKKCIQWYIRIFLGEVALFFIISMALSFYTNYYILEGEELVALFVSVMLIVFIFILVLFLRFIYHLVYGNLLHKLKQNYEELSRMEE
jgi:hypothetical protein